MNRALFLRALRDYWLLLAALTLGVLILEVFLVRVLLEAFHDLEHLRVWIARPIVQTLLRIALGADLAGDLTPTVLSTIGLGHPILYALAWIWVLTIATGAVAGEIGRGTADLLLTLPVPRQAVYGSATAVLALGAAVLSFAPLFGLWLGEQFTRLPEPLDFARLWPVAVNFWALNLAIGGVGLLVSSVASRRGPALGVLLAALLVSDLMNFVAQFWAAVRPLAIFGFLHYYRLLPTVRSGALPWGDVMILLTMGAVSWVGGLIWFRRRDIPAV